MRRSILALLLAGTLVLSGCASMLERDYKVTSRYEPVSNAVDSSAALRVENYQGLVNALLYLVSEGEEHGVLNLYNYTAQEVEADLTRACLEVVQEDPLGAYAVDYIKHESALIVTYYEANIHITYRRTPEQVASIVSVTGSSAIRRELRNTLTSFSSEAVLRVSYFNEEEDYILDLVRQAYYDAPYAALGMPEELKSLALTLVPQSATAESLYDAVREDLTIEEDSRGSSAYDALVNGTADSEGAALAYQLLCDQTKVECVVVRGQLNGEAHYWNIVSEDGETYRHVDLSAGAFALTDTELLESGGYQWDTGEYPACSASDGLEEG